MLTLTTPSALFVLLGLLVPVAIHLWNRRPGREVAVGSLRWLEAGANRRLRNLRPEQLWLLLLRAALLAVLAVGVAGPVWRQHRVPSRGQVLLSPEAAAAPALANVRPVIDSLRRRGYELRWLAAGFPKLSDTTWRAGEAGLRDKAHLLLAADSAGAGQYEWARVRQAAQAFAGQPLYVLTPAALRGFRGAHAPLPATVSWQTLPTDSAATWLQAAALHSDSLRLQIGRTQARQTAFQLLTLARPHPGELVRVAGLPARRLEDGAGGQLRLVAAVGPSQQRTPVHVSSQPLHVVLYATADFAPDARCLQAGLRAAAVGLLRPLQLRLTTTPPDTAGRPDWFFWLSDAPLPAAWASAVSQGTHVWQEAAGPGAVGVKSRLAGEGAAVAILRRGAVRAALPAGEFPLWADGLGRPVLTARRLGHGAFYFLNTRLSPAWSELAESPELPARLLDLLQPDTNAPEVTLAPEAAFDATVLAAHDQRSLDPSQLGEWPRLAGPKPLPAAVRPAPSGFREADLRPWTVLLVALLFAFERGLASRREKNHVLSNAS